MGFRSEDVSPVSKVWSRVPTLLVVGRYEGRENKVSPTSVVKVNGCVILRL